MTTRMRSPRQKGMQGAVLTCALLGSTIMGCPKPQETSARPKVPVVEIERVSPKPEKGYAELKRTSEERIKASEGRKAEMKKKDKQDDPNLLHRFFNETKDIVDEATEKVAEEANKQP